MLLEWMQTFGIDESLHYMLVITLKQAQSYSHYYKKAMRNTMRNARNMTRGTGTINGTINDQLLISSKHSHLPHFTFTSISTVIFQISQSLHFEPWGFTDGLWNSSIYSFTDLDTLK